MAGVFTGFFLNGHRVFLGKYPGVRTLIVSKVEIIHKHLKIYNPV